MIRHLLLGKAERAVDVMYYCKRRADAADASVLDQRSALVCGMSVMERRSREIRLEVALDERRRCTAAMRRAEARSLRYMRLADRWSGGK